MIGFKSLSRNSNAEHGRPVLLALPSSHNPTGVQRGASELSAWEGKDRGQNHQKGKTNFKATECNPLNGFPDKLFIFLGFQDTIYPAAGTGVPELLVPRARRWKPPRVYQHMNGYTDVSTDHGI